MIGMISNDPVVVERTCMLCVKAVVECGFGLTLNWQSGRRDVFCAKRDFAGTSLALTGVTKVTAKCSLHAHLLQFGGFPPWLCGKVGHVKPLVDAVSTAIDSLFKAESPKELHVARWVEHFVQKKVSQAADHLGRHCHCGIFACPPVHDTTLHQQHCLRNVAEFWQHIHCFTCRDGEMGFSG